MLRIAILAAILGGLTVFPGLYGDFVPAFGPAVTDASNVPSRASRPRRVPPVPTTCKETVIPEPAPSCGP